jgi:bile acid:Na+ symporter, BASS family
MMMHITLPLTSVLLFLITLMFLVGLQETPGQVLAATKNHGLRVRSLVANIVVLPIVAVLVMKVVHLTGEIATGVLLMAAAPGAPFLPLLAAAAKGNVAFAVGLMIVLQVVSVVTTPITLQMILPVEAAIRVPVLRVIGTLILAQLLPLGLGMLVKHRAAPLGRTLGKPVQMLFTLGLIGTVVFVIVPHVDVLGQAAGGGALAIMLFLVVVAWPIGWGLGGVDVGIRKTLAIGTSLRNVGLCLLIAAQNFPDTGVAAAVTAYFLIQAIANFGWKVLSRVPERGSLSRPL